MSFQTGISETMRQLKRELRDGGHDVSAVIRDPTRRREYHRRQGQAHAARPTAAKAKDRLASTKRPARISKEDMDALRLLDTVHM